MSIQLHDTIKSILQMGYYKNDNARSGHYTYGHEEAVAGKLKDFGFSSVDKSLYPKVTKTLLKKWADSQDDTELRKVTQGIKEGEFILQPAGSQGFPDVLIVDFGFRFVGIECKSGKDGQCPMWNDNLPKSDIIYVLSSGIKNETTVFLGRDVITQGVYDNQKKMFSEMKGLVDKYKTLNDKIDIFNRGWATKFRPQNFQGGGHSKSNYFTHNDRTICETRVLEYAKL